MIEQLVTVPEAAEILRVEVVTIRKWMYEGRIPYFKLSRRVVFKEKDLEAFIGGNYHPVRRGAKGNE